MTDPEDRLSLSRDVALVLFETLARAAPDGTVRPMGGAERRALWDLEAELERILPEPFLPNYAELLAEARQRLDPDEPGLPKHPLVVFVDVDDTLVRSVGTKRIPIPEVIRRVRELHSAGVDLHCWSTGGAAYAHDSAVELGLADCFSCFLAKPHLMVDDQPPSEWRNLLCLHPNEISSMSVQEIETATGRSAG